MPTDTTYTDIESRLTSDAAKEEHKRIWKTFKNQYSPTYLSAYLTYLQTFANVHALLNRDVSQLQPKEVYLHNNAISSLVNQHNSAIKMLGFSPAHAKGEPAKTGRKLKDTSKNALLS